MTTSTTPNPIRERARVACIALAEQARHLGRLLKQAAVSELTADPEAPTVAQVRAVVRDGRRVRAGRPVASITAAVAAVQDWRRAASAAQIARLKARREAAGKVYTAAKRRWADVERLRADAAEMRDLARDCARHDAAHLRRQADALDTQASRLREARTTRPFPGSGVRTMLATADLAGLLADRRRAEVGNPHDTARRGDTRVTWVDTLEECTVTAAHSKDWDRWRSGRSQGPDTVVDVTVRAQELRRADLPGGVRTPDGTGLCTLGARRVLDADGVTLWRAAWSRRTRGHNWTVEVGWIAESGDALVHHTGSADAAIRLLRRRMAASADAPTEGVPDLVLDGETGRRHADLVVTMADARRAGLCTPGIVAFADRHDIDVSVGISVRALWALTWIEPANRRLVLEACRQAILRAESRQVRASARKELDELHDWAGLRDAARRQDTAGAAATA